VSDPDPTSGPPRSPYARPKPGADQPANYLVDPPPSDFTDTAARPPGWPAGSLGGDGRGRTADAKVVDAKTATEIPTPPGRTTVHPERRPPVQVTMAKRGPRRARLVIKHVDPWTVMKVSFVVSVVMLAVCVVAVAVIYAVLGKMGVWNQINTLVNEVSPTTTSKALRNPLSGSRVIGIAAIVGAINVVLFTALATLGAAIYNLISDLVGGVEVTLTDP
jgi:hypothetical protein